MNKSIPILGGLLVVQLVFALAVNLTDKGYGAFQAVDKLLEFEKERIDTVRIEDGEESVLLQRKEGRWLLPRKGDFPADHGSIEQLLDNLTALEKGWPVATTSGAVRRFKVADDAFERKLTLISNEKVLAQLFIGTSPGFRKVHARPADEGSVFAVEFNTWEANAGVDDWIDKEILKLEETDVERIEISGVVLQRENGELQLSGLEEKEETNTEEVNLLVKNLTGLQIQSLLGTEAKAEYRQDQDVLEIKVLPEEKDVLSYRFSKPKEASYYILKRSDLDHYFKIAEFKVKPILDKTREKFVRLKETPTEIADGEKQAEALEN